MPEQNIFNDLSSIYNVYRPIDVMIGAKLRDGSTEIDVYKFLMKLFMETGGAGSYNIESIKQKLLDYYKNGRDESKKKAFNLITNFYATGGSLQDIVKYPYVCPNPKNTKNQKKEPVIVSNLDNIIGIKEEQRGKRNMSIVMCTTPYVSPMLRDAEKVEVFLNFLPSTVISRCVPYLELEFSFDRKIDQYRGLKTANMLKFLLGGEELNESPNDPNQIMFSARSWERKSTDEGEKGGRISLAGMEMFTSPQTLVNMDQLKAGSRYVNVRDVTRPFMSLENVSINVSPTSGLYSYKKATAVIKLHDSSRLSDIADLLQPTTYTSVTAWLTYGWRHPYEPNHDLSTKTYADYINGNMLVKEAYGLSNVSFSFDAAGQVTITLDLYTKSISELRAKIVADAVDTFKNHRKELEDLAKAIAELRKELGFKSMGSVEIRAFQILDSAENGHFPDVDPVEVENAIESLKKFIAEANNSSKKKNGGKTSNSTPANEAKRKATATELLSKLKTLYATKNYPDPKGKNGVTKKFSMKERYQEIATDVIRKKYEKLQDNDPFLITEEKFAQMKLETEYKNEEHPLLAEIKNYNSHYQMGEKLQTAVGKNIQKRIVSFGKLFSVFMGSALFSIDTIDEYQLYFYCFNDKCGPASYTNIAEFPINLPQFLAQYKEMIANKGTETMTVEEFFKLAIDAQISDQRSVAYGFLSQGAFEPWAGPNEPAKLTKDGKSIIEKTTMRFGSFVMPQVEVYIETTHEKFPEGSPIDLLKFYESPGSMVGNEDPSNRAMIYKKICKIHVYDKTTFAYKGPAHMLRSGDGASGNPVTYIEVTGEGATEWVKLHEKSSVEHMKELYDIAKKYVDLEGYLNVNQYKIGNNKDIKDLVSKMVPTIVIGTNASSVYEAGLSSNKDATLAAAQMLGHNAGKKPAGLPAGSAVGNLPLRVIPAALTMRTVGCPLLNYSQMFFVDFNTGTTIDNIYGICGITHTLSPGKFDSSLTMAFYDAYGRFESARSQLASTIEIVNHLNQSTATKKKSSKEEIKDAFRDLRVEPDTPPFRAPDSIDMKMYRDDPNNPPRRLVGNL